MFFINKVLASEVAGSVGTQDFQSFTASIVPLLIFIAIFYFLLIRPQQKRQKEHEKEVASLRPNDKIVTSGGIFGVVKKVKEKTVIVEISKDVDIEVLSSSVSLAGDTDKPEVKKINKKK